MNLHKESLAVLNDVCRELGIIPADVTSKPTVIAAIDAHVKAHPRTAAGNWTLHVVKAAVKRAKVGRR